MPDSLLDRKERHVRLSSNKENTGDILGEAIKRILIVDDEENTRIGLSKLLVQDGFEVESAANGNEALDFLVERKMVKKDRVSHMSDKTLKTLLHLCAKSATQHNQAYKLYYEKKKQEGKPHYLILNNISNKLLRTL